MAITLQQAEVLYGQEKYEELVAQASSLELDRSVSLDDHKLLLRVGWAYHQLGRYWASMGIMRTLIDKYGVDSEIGEDARRVLAHGLLQELGDIDGANAIIREIPSSDAREALRMNLMLIAARKNVHIDAREIVSTITNVVQKEPLYTIHDAHTINNGTAALHEARDQEDAQSYLMFLNGFMELAVGLYTTIDTRKHHLAGCLFRLSFIAEADDWIDGALVYINECIENWQKAISLEENERFQQNLSNALTRRDYLVTLKRSSVT